MSLYQAAPLTLGTVSPGGFDTTPALVTVPVGRSILPTASLALVAVSVAFVDPDTARLAVLVAFHARQVQTFQRQRGEEPDRRSG